MKTIVACLITALAVGAPSTFAQYAPFTGGKASYERVAPSTKKCKRVVPVKNLYPYFISRAR